VERPTVLENLLDSRTRLLELVADLDADQLLGPDLEIVNPPLWEIGHVGWFQERWIRRNLDELESFKSDSEFLYNSFETPHSRRWGLALPSLEETLSYMQAVLDNSKHRIEGRVLTPKEVYFYKLATYHEDMHCEALTYSRQTLGYSPPSLGAVGNVGWSNTVEDNSEYRDIHISGGVFLLGGTDTMPFVFDNEKWAHPVNIQPFNISSTAVTNEQFLGFVDDGGYNRPEYWGPEGWEWRQRTGAEHPVYWLPRPNGIWYWRRYNENLPLESNHPVIHVNWYEAKAYCAWAKRRLPTEGEWEIAASGEPTNSGKGISNRRRMYPWGDKPPSPDLANLDGAASGVVDVRAFPTGDSAFGCRQMLGNTWEWTDDAFYPFPGFVVDPYREYSAPWFGYQKILRGGCWATRSRLIRNTWRNFYPPDRRDVFAGFRTCSL
jgi:iron(II)-dependent oxidoreductase